MAFSGTSEVIKTTLQKINSLGVYTLPIYQGLAPAFGRIIFGDEQFGVANGSNINLRDILVDATTSEDGRTISWRNIQQSSISTTVNGALTASTSVVVTNITGFSAGDMIKIREGTTDLKRYVTAVDTGTKTLTISAAVTCSDAAPITRLSYAKSKGSVIDRLDYDPTSTRYDNYFQDFGAKLSLTLDQINSHYEINVPQGFPDPKKALKSKLMMDEAVKNYIRNKVAQKIGIEIIGDIARQFYDGEKALVGSRYYTGGLGDVVSTVAISSSDSDEQKFEDIWQTVYGVKNKSFQAGNRRVVMVANDPFIKEFSTLAAGKVQFTEIPNEYGYDLSMVKLPGGAGSVELMYEPQLDALEFTDGSSSKSICFVLPMDLISAKTRKWIDVDNIKDAKRAMGGFDTKIKRSVTDEDTGDTFTFLFFYWMGFVFGGNDLDIYKKIIIS